MQRLFALTLLVLGISASSAAAQGRSFLNTPVNSADEYARIIERCSTKEELNKAGSASTELNPSCEDMIESFNRAFDDIDDVKTQRELADYIRTLQVVECGPHSTTRIARLLNGSVDLNYKRELRPGEKCLGDQSANRLISSMVCGQWLPDKIAFAQPAKTTTVVTGTPVAGQTITLENNVTINLPPPPTPILDTGKEIVNRTKFEPPPPVDGHHNWFSFHRNGKWFWPVVAGVTVVAVCTIPESSPCVRHVTQVVDLSGGEVLVNGSKVVVKPKP